MTSANDAIVCTMPFVAPSEFLFGDDAVMKMKMQPVFE